MESTLHFLTDGYKLAALCDDYISLSYSESFCDCGEVTCVLPQSREYIPEVGDLLLCGERLVYIVESVTRDTAKGTVTLRGSGILSYLGHRIVNSAGRVYAKCEGLIENLVQLNALTAVPGTLEIDSPESDESVDIVIEEGNLLGIIREIAAIWGRGLSLVYDFEAEKFIFSVTNTRDRCLGSSEAPIFLSEGFDTVCATAASTDITGYVNSVTVRGGQRDDGIYYRVTVSAADYDFGDGFDDSAYPARQLFVRSGIGMGIYTTKNADGTTTFDEDAYLAALRTRGRQELASHRPTYGITASLSASAAKEISVGDRCTLFSPATDVQEVCVMEKRCDIAEGCAVYSAVLRAF